MEITRENISRTIVSTVSNLLLMYLYGKSTECEFFFCTNMIVLSRIHETALVHPTET